MLHCVFHPEGRNFITIRTFPLSIECRICRCLYAFKDILFDLQISKLLNCGCSFGIKRTSRCGEGVPKTLTPSPWTSLRTSSTDPCTNRSTDPLRTPLYGPSMKTDNNLTVNIPNSTVAMKREKIRLKSKKKKKGKDR